MKIIRGLCNIGEHHYGAAITIGKFDGVHRGHQQLFKQMVSYAQVQKVPSMVIIFEPSPNDFFNSNFQKEKRISPFREKCFYIAQEKIDYVLILSFNQDFSRLSATDFIEQILIEGLRIRKLWIGDDFRFGFQRKGDYELLQSYAEKGAFLLSNIESYFINQVRVSSSAIRKKIANKQFQQVEELLGHPLSISGYIVKGKQLGHTIGYPTANLGMTERHQATLLLLDYGVYWVRVKLYDSRRENYQVYVGVANFGVKPTIDNQLIHSFETHCLDLNEAIYSRFVRIEIVKFIRAEKKFSSLGKLTEQIEKDVSEVKNQISSSKKES